MSPLSRSSHALVTGGGRGIGLAIAAALSNAGATVTVLGRNRATLDEAVASGAAQFAATADVADQASVKSAIAEAAARQPIDILIANAGAAESAPFGRSDAALFQRMMDVNFMGVVHATQAVLPGMVERRRGRIVNVSSEAGRVGSSGSAVYSAAKGGVLGFTKALAIENGRYGITANAVAPGPIETPLLMAAPEQLGDVGKRIVDTMIGSTNLRRLGHPDEVAAAIAFLASDDASYVTGQSLGVSGGLARI